MLRAGNNSSTPIKPLKWYKKLATRKGRLEAEAFLVEGDRAIKQVIANRPDAIIEIITVQEPPPIYHNYPARFVTESQFHSICLTKTPQGTLAVVRLPLETYSSQLPEKLGAKILLLEDIQDPGNVGALIRTAAAFNYSGIILTEKCADPLSPKCVQASAGTVLYLWMRRTTQYLELVEMLKQEGYSSVAADLNGMEDASILSRQNKLILMLGNEASGLSKSILDMSDYRLKIPITRKKAESLNVAACGAIFMFLSSSKS